MTSSRYHVRCESKESAKKVKSTKVQTYYYMYWIGINWVSCNEGDIFRTKSGHLGTKVVSMVMTPFVTLETRVIYGPTLNCVLPVKKCVHPKHKLLQFFKYMPSCTIFISLDLSEKYE